jgi:predicted nucleotidyltransferase
LGLSSELLAVHAVLAGEGVPHALCGGIAANLYRTEVRATVDVDLCIVTSAAALVDLARRFEDGGWAVHPEWRAAELLLLERAGQPRVDLLIATTAFERQAVERATPFDMDGTTINVLVAEDLIVFKLAAGRARDYEAVTALIAAHGPKLDATFISESLEEIGLADRWDRALEMAERERS